MRSVYILILISLLITVSYAKDPDIYVIGFDIQKGSPQESELMKVAKINNGTYISAENAATPDELQRALQQAYRGLSSNRLNIIQTLAAGVTYIWTPDNFDGFYYDIDNNIGKERLYFMPSAVDANLQSATLTDQQVVTDPETGEKSRSIIYRTEAQPKDFKYKPWGQYWVIGFLADKYFASYDDKNVTQAMRDNNPPETISYPALKSKNLNLMTNEQISKVLIDSNSEVTITSATPVKLEEGYVLNIKSIDVDGNKAYVELSKNGQIVDNKVVQPSIQNAGMNDQTYYYKVDLGDTKEIVQIAVHFKNAFKGSDTNIATIDGIFQISDTTTPVKADQKYGKMSIREVNPSKMTVTMDNKDNQITLSKNKDIVLMLDVHIKTADQDDAKPLRFYIYKKYTLPGTYEIRGSIADLGASEFVWDNSTFSGFYYDIDNNLGDEQVIFRPTDIDMNKSSATLSDQPDTKDASGNSVRGITYYTQAQLKKFKFKAWGQYHVIGFLANKYFAAYNKTPTADTTTTIPYLYDASKNRNLMTNEQISQVLVDDNNEQTITSANPLVLQNGYQLAIKSIDVDGNKAYLELTKNGQVVDSKVVQPSITNSKMADQTYYYKASLGDTTDIIQIAVHFKNAFRGADTNIATVDGEFQVADTATALKTDQQYDKMSIRNVDATGMTITMDNKDNQITLSKNKDVVLMQDVHIKTADQDGTAATPLRYYIYKAATIAGANVTAPAAALAAVLTNATNVTAPAKPAAENVSTPAPATTPAPAPNATKTAANATNATKAPAAKQPGFEGVFAIAGLVAVAYMVIGRKQ